jgi:hypothetical protein
MQAGVFAQAAALGLAVALLATLIPLRRALAVAPVEAIRVGARAARSSGLAWIVRRLRLPGGSLSNMSLRNVLRAPRRTMMTVLGIGAVVAITVALAGLIDSFGAPPFGSAGARPNGGRRQTHATRDATFTAVQGAAATTDAVNQTMSQFTDVLTITVAIAMIMALLIAYNSAAINAEERTREHATMFAYGISAARVTRGNLAEAFIRLLHVSCGVMPVRDRD